MCTGQEESDCGPGWGPAAAVWISPHQQHWRRPAWKHLRSLNGETESDRQQKVEMGSVTSVHPRKGTTAWLQQGQSQTSDPTLTTGSQPRGVRPHPDPLCSKRGKGQALGGEAELGPGSQSSSLRGGAEWESKPLPPLCLSFHCVTGADHGDYTSGTMPNPGTCGPCNQEAAADTNEEAWASGHPRCP